jgi:hypothetical protein
MPESINDRDEVVLPPVAASRSDAGADTSAAIQLMELAMARGARLIGQEMLAAARVSSQILSRGLRPTAAPSAGLDGQAIGTRQQPLVVEGSRSQQRRDRNILEQIFPGKGYGGAVAAYSRASYLASLFGAGPYGREYAGIGAGLGFLAGGPIGALAGGLLGALFGRKKDKRLQAVLSRAFLNTPEAFAIEAYLFNITENLRRFGYPSLGLNLLSRATFASAAAPSPVSAVQVQRVEIRLDSALDRTGARRAARLLWRELSQLAELDAQAVGVVGAV